jgi:ABC-type taurine transport system substrate-binding protein
MLLLYVLINGKRKQRIVPIIPPTQNTSVAYTEAVAGLYMVEKNNKNIADKMITYFNEHIRNRYFLHIYASNEDQVSLLSRKSGVAADQVKELYEHIQFISRTNQVTDTELLTLNMHIQNFYKNRL